jgi:hypothetical protein
MADLASIANMFGRQIAPMDTWDAEVMPGGARRYLEPAPGAAEREAAAREEMAWTRAAYDAEQSRLKSIADLRNEMMCGKPKVLKLP